MSQRNGNRAAEQGVLARRRDDDPADIVGTGLECPLDATLDVTALILVVRAHPDDEIAARRIDAEVEGGRSDALWIMNVLHTRMVSLESLDGLDCSILAVAVDHQNL